MDFSVQDESMPRRVVRGVDLYKFLYEEGFPGKLLKKLPEQDRDKEAYTLTHISTLRDIIRLNRRTIFRSPDGKGYDGLGIESIDLPRTPEVDEFLRNILSQPVDSQRS